MTVPGWVRDPDPWLSTRMRHRAQITATEAEVMPAVVQAMTEYLDTTRATVLGDPAEGALVAAVSMRIPDLSGWPDDSVWSRIVRRLILPVIERVYARAFTAGSRGIEVNDAPYRRSFLELVGDRLSPRLWPRGVFEEVRAELLAGLDRGEGIDALRDRVGAVLRIDAVSRPLRDLAARLREQRDNPDTPPDERRRIRDELRDIYATAEAEERAWQPDARRIARTETMASLNGGTHAAGNAWADATGDPLYQRWLATNDQRVRDTHADADGQTVPIGSVFRVGGVPLRFPGDPLGTAEETIQCRCTATHQEGP